MAILGLFLDLIFFLAGLYLYLFSIGGLHFQNPQLAKRAEAFRQENARWLRIGALALMAIMFFNVAYDLRQLFGN